MYKRHLTIKINTPGVLAAFFLITFFMAKTFSMPVMLANGFIAFSGFACLAYVMLKRKASSWYLFIAFILSMLMFMSILFNENASVLEILWIWSFLGAALLLTQYHISSKTLSIIFLFIALVYGFQIVSGIEATDAIGVGSGNNISIYVLFYSFLIYMRRYEEGKGITYWPCVVAFVLSLWGNGRAGILSCAIMFVLLFLYDCIVIRKVRIGTIIKIAILLAIAWFVIDRFLGQYIETLLDKMDKYGYESARSDIWKEYFSVVFNSLGNFIFGVPANVLEAPLLARYGGNPHNAFLMLHSKFGIFGVLFVGVMLLGTVIRYYKQKRYVYLIVIVIWFIRSVFDWTGFPGVFDVLFFYFVIKSNSNEDDVVQLPEGEVMK